MQASVRNAAHHLFALIAISLAASDGRATPASAEQLLASEPPELVERLLRDRLMILEEVDGGRDSFVIAYVIFERSMDDVVALLRQAERQMEYRPELRSVETVEVLEDGRVDEQRLRVVFTSLVYRIRYREKLAEGRLEWSLDPRFDNDVAKLEGFWELRPYASDSGRTLARFGSNVDVGRAVPRFLQRGMSRRTVVRYLENCRQWIDSDGVWRP